MEFEDIRVFEEVVKQLMTLDEEDRAKVYRWVGEKCELALPNRPSKVGEGGSNRASQDDDEVARSIESFDAIADLMAAVDARTDQDRALIVAAFLSRKNGKDQLTSKEVNDELKDLGRGAKNITDVLNGLIRKKPALAMQTSKTGQSKQGRKTYKVTVPGFARVESLIAKGFTDEAA